jgi:hypothetical protein
VISLEIINQIKHSVCAIGYFTEEPMAVYRRLKKSGGDLTRLPKKTIGTGFLVGDTVVLSNRHVVDGLRDSGTPLGWWFLSFIVTTDEGQCEERGFFVKKAFIMSWKRPDAALIQFSISENKERAKGLVPVGFGALSSVSVGRPVAICGYLQGNDLLDLTQFDIQRFGPVFHQGFISALAPHDAANPRQVISFLTDIRSGGGFSGSPVFLPDNGSVIGLHFAGVAGLAGIALPVDEERVAGWITVLTKTSANTPGFIIGTDAGDVESVDVLPSELFQRLKEASNIEEAARLLMDYDSTIDELTALKLVASLRSYLIYQN